jgi:hypothetical protein
VCDFDNTDCKCAEVDDENESILDREDFCGFCESVCHCDEKYDIAQWEASDY